MPRRSREPKHPMDCHERALRLLSVRPRSRHELAKRLRLAGFESQEVHEELDRLEAVGLVDDESFARAVAEHQVKVRRAGRRAVSSALAAKGVDRGTIEETLASLGGNDEGRAEELALERARRLSGLPPEKAYARLVGLLQRRGYDGSVARSAARSAILRSTDGG
ncbi:MAG TPA: regulatory protein RecX [Actinomycetota bacterium]|nr:regulatory protein RecX [Actinomycetota bacterium]